MSPGGDLWQVGHAQHLTGLAELAQELSDGVRHVAPNARVHFIKNQSGDCTGR